MQFSYLFLIRIVWIKNFVKSSQSCINIQPRNSYCVIVIPIVWSLLFIWVVKDCLIWSAWLFCSIACWFETFLSPVSLRLTIRWGIGGYTVSMRDHRYLFNKSLRGLEGIVEVNRQNMRSRDVIFPSNLNRPILCSKNCRSWKVRMIPVLSMPAISIYWGLWKKSIRQDLFGHFHHFDSILIHGDLPFRIDVLLEGNHHSRLTCDFSLKHERSKLDRVQQVRGWIVCHFVAVWECNHQGKNEDT